MFVSRDAVQTATEAEGHAGSEQLQVFLRERDKQLNLDAERVKQPEQKIGDAEKLAEEDKSRLAEVLRRRRASPRR